MPEKAIHVSRLAERQRKLHAAWPIETAWMGSTGGRAALSRADRFARRGGKHVSTRKLLLLAVVHSFLDAAPLVLRTPCSVVGSVIV